MARSTDYDDFDPEEEEALSGYESIIQDQTALLRRSSLSEATFFSPPQPRSTHPVALFFFVVLPALFGLSFYFLYRPREISSETRSSLPHTAVAPLVLISIDGFRHEYLQRSVNDKPLAPTLQRLAREGVVATKGMQAVMPTKTWPNHWSLVTGLYAESHGIIENTMYDPQTKQWFHHMPSDPQWFHGEPIWKTLQRTPLVTIDENGTTTKTEHNYTAASVFWPGSEVEKHRPDAFWVYDGNKPYEKRNQRAMELLMGTAKDLDRPAQFVTLYYEGVDHSGHTYGPNSPEVNKEIARADKALADFFKELETKLGSNANIIVVSDHGMTDISKDRVVDLSSAMAAGTVQDVRITPLGLWFNQTVPSEKVHEEIQKELLKHDDHVKVYLKANIPERWHLKNNRLITDIVTMAQLGWTVVYPHQQLVPGAERRLPRDLMVQAKGEHGFDNTEQDMHAIFIAKGPAFQTSATVDNFESVDLYPLICQVFNATPAPNNGTLQKSLTSVLKVES